MDGKGSKKRKTKFEVAGVKEWKRKSQEEKVNMAKEELRRMRVVRDEVRRQTGAN